MTPIKISVSLLFNRKRAVFDPVAVSQILYSVGCVGAGMPVTFNLNSVIAKQVSAAFLL